MEIRVFNPTSWGRFSIESAGMMSIEVDRWLFSADEYSAALMRELSNSPMPDYVSLLKAAGPKAVLSIGGVTGPVRPGKGSTVWTSVDGGHPVPPEYFWVWECSGSIRPLLKQNLPEDLLRAFGSRKSGHTIAILPRIIKRDLEWTFRI